jgi:photosystem II stability/assembly factor-like uncharacterized protein
MSFIRWTETQPAGDVNAGWMVGAISDDGSCLITGVYGSGKLYYSSNGGSSWSVTDPYGDSSNRSWYWASMSSDGTKIFAGAHGGRLWHSSNSGSSWTEVRPDGNRDYSYPYCVMSNDGTKLAMCEYNGKVWYSSNSGSNWTEVRTTAGYDFLSISGDGTRIFTGIWNSRCYYSSNSGSNWSEVQPKGDTNGNWQTCAMSDDGTKLIVGEYNGGRIYYSSNSGTNWVEIQPAGNIGKNWYGATMSSDGTNILLAPSGDYLYKSTDSASSWYQQRPRGDISNTWTYCCAIAGDKSKWIAGGNGERIYLGTLTSASTFYVNTGSTAGGTGTTNLITGADRAFATLGETTTQLSWAASDCDLEVLCCGSVADASRCLLPSTYVQSPYTFYIRGNPNDPNGANTTGIYDATKYTKLRDPVQQEGIQISSTSIQKISVSKIQFYATQQTLHFYLAQGCACDVYLENCLLAVASGVSIHSYMIWQRATNTSTLSIRNCVLNYEGAGVCSGTAILFEGGNSKIYNSIVRGFTTGLNQNGVQTVVSKNCAVFDNTNDFGTITTIDHCASDDGDGTNPITIASWAAQFASASYATATDFRLLSTSELLNAGVGPSVDALVPSTDILAFTRSGATSTVGPFEHWSGYVNYFPHPLPGRV